MENRTLYDEDFFEICDSEVEYDLSAVSSEPFYEYDNKMFSCSFTGHRNLSAAEVRNLVPKLKSTVLYLISLGVKEFHSGGALGFDTLAATVVYDIAREHRDVKLILELPYPKQAEFWSDKNKRIYEFIKSKSDEINVHFSDPKNKEEATKHLLARNRLMIDKSQYCVCFFRDENTKKGGTSYTVNYAKLHDLQILNLAEQESYHGQE